MKSPSNIPVFFRCKHEGFYGPPFSIEWAYATPAHTEIVSGAHLIKPLREWWPQFTDDESLPILRGVTLADLKQHGESPAWIAERMNLVLHDRELFSLAPDDGEHLLRLFEVAQVQPEFEVRNLYADTLIADLTRLNRISTASLTKLRAKAELRVPIYWPSVSLAQMHALRWADVADPG